MHAANCARAREPNGQRETSGYLYRPRTQHLGANIQHPWFVNGHAAHAKYETSREWLCNAYLGHYRCCGRNSITYLAAHEPLIFLRGPSLACKQFSLGVPWRALRSVLIEAAHHDEPCCRWPYQLHAGDFSQYIRDTFYPLRTILASDVIEGGTLWTSVPLSATLESVTPRHAARQRHVMIIPFP
eukprot:6195370-Pleurochrysis_carterae.AAC.1